jgi:acyl carrier protein
MDPLSDDIASAVRRFIADNFTYRSGTKPLSESASLLEGGLIDSPRVMELIQFLETTFAIRIADDEILPENLDSINRIVGYVRRKLNTAEGKAFTHACALLNH